MKQKYLLLTMIILVFLFFSTSLSVLAVTPNLELTPASQSVIVGKQATISVVVEDVTDLRGASITLNFDVTKLQYISSANGGFIPSATLLEQSIDNTNGSVTLDIAGLSASAYASGSGTIMTVIFNRIATGDTNITFGSTTLRDKDNITITHTKGNGCSITYCLGDFDGDNVIGFEDLMLFAMAYGSCEGEANWNLVCDLNSDGCIEFEDLMIFAMHYGEDCGSCTPPSPPTLSDPGTTLTSPATYTVNWTTVSGATSYKIQESTSSSFSTPVEYTTSSTSRIFSHTITSCINYYYRVAAIDSCGQSDWSNVVDIQICSTIVPPTVITLPVENMTQTSARFCGRIDDTGGEEPFDIGFVYTWKSGGPETVVKYPIEKYCEIVDLTGLTPGTYGYRFWAENSAGIAYGNYLEFYILTPSNAKWTLMFYMDGDSDLEPYYWQNVSLIESVSSIEEVNIVIQMDPFDDCTGTYRYYVTSVEAGSEYPLYPEDIVQNLPEQDMSDPAVLTDFINWASDNYPADHYMLFIVDHGAGWKDIDMLFKGILWDATSGGQMMQIPELAQSLESANINIDILCLKACLMQMIEVAWELGMGMSSPPNYLIASENVSWTSSLPYEEFLNQIIVNPNIEQSIICETIVNGYIDNLPTYSATMSALHFNNEFLNSSLDIINNFANALLVSTYQEGISNAKSTAQSYANPQYKDLYDFAEKIYNNVPDCQTEAQAIMDLITNIIIAEGHNGPDMENSHGLSTYLIDSPSEYDSDYDSLKFANDTQWDEFLQYTPTIVPPTVTTLHADNITQTSARVWISIDDTGGEDPFDAGVYWGLKSKLFYSDSETESIGSNVTKIKNITENNKLEEISEAEDLNSTDSYFEEEKISSIIEKIGVGVYSVTLTGLSCNTTYQYRAYAENSAGEGTGDYEDFTTLACSGVVPPTVSRGSLYDYSATQVEAWGKIESTGGENPYKAGMYIKDLTTDGAAVGWYITGDFQAGDEYYIIIPNLISGHLYSRCAYAENSAGKGYSDWANFTKP